MNKRLVSRVPRVVFLLALVLAVSLPAPTIATAQPAGNTTAFVLRAPADRIAAIASRHGLTLVRQVEGHPDVYLVTLSQTPSTPLAKSAPAGLADAIQPAADATQQLTQSVLTDPDVLYFEVNGSANIPETQAGPQLNESTVAILDSLSNRTLAAYFGTTVWNRYIDQPAATIIELALAHTLATGAGVVVAIIDTGVDPYHPALQGSLVSGYDFTRDVAGMASEWADLDPSTVAILQGSTASILDPSTPVSLNESTVAILDQVTAASLDITRLPPAFGHGTMVAGLAHMVAPTAGIMPLKAFKADGTANLFDIERAIYYAVDHGAKVINMSFSMATASTELTHAIDYAAAHGVISFASAGNSGQSTVVFPAGFRDVMAVGSTSLIDGRSSFSNYGDHLVKLAAPGETLITLYPGGRYASASGTSFSTALVTGGTGLLAQLDPTVNQRTAGRDLDDGAVKRPEWEMGDGRLDLYQTLLPHVSAPAPPALPDNISPTVTLISPRDGDTITGLFPLVASASDNVGVVGVQLTLDGVNLGAEGTVAPYQWNWNTAAVANGTHVLGAAARDAAGNRGTASINVTVTNDTTPPTVTLTSPTAGAVVTGTFALGASASDDVGVVGVQFTLDGANLGAEQTTAPYALSWDSTTVANGVHVLGATARDAAGNRGVAPSVSLTVTN